MGLVHEDQAKKGSSANVKFPAIAGDYPGGCATAEAGDGYYQLVMGTDGVYLSMLRLGDTGEPGHAGGSECADGGLRVDRDSRSSTIRVWVNGTERLTGWHYDEDDNTVVFDEGIPEDNDVVRISRWHDRLRQRSLAEYSRGLRDRPLFLSPTDYGLSSLGWFDAEDSLMCLAVISGCTGATSGVDIVEPRWRRRTLFRSRLPTAHSCMQEKCSD